MKTIHTKYLGPTDTKGMRILATDGDTKLAFPWTYSGDEDRNHQRAAEMLKDKLQWKGVMVGGHTKDGMVWVFVSGPRIK